MLIPVLAIAMMQGVCPMTIGVGRDGALFSGRFYGWYRTSTKTLESDLRGGCFDDANPSQVTSVKLLIAADAPKPKIELIFSILHKEGWPREKAGSTLGSISPEAPLDYGS
jgi:hypothetical protein